MSKFKLYIEYEGTRYNGWQMQRSGKTIQGKLIEAAEKIFKSRDFEIYGSGRTDAGVHAICQIAHLEANTMLAPEIIRLKLNDELPADINIIEVEKAHPKFHARYDAKRRSYIYQIATRRTAFGKPFVWWIKDELNVGRMIKAAKLFVGMHDFASFADKESDEKSTKVLIESLEVKQEEDLIIIRIIGSHFLWKMVRRVVGVLVEIGRGNMKDTDITYFLEHNSPTPAQYTAPPSGLFLEGVLYEEKQNFKELDPVIQIKKKEYFKK